MQVKARGELCLPKLPIKAKIAHKIPVVQNLFTLAVQADIIWFQFLTKQK